MVARRSSAVGVRELKNNTSEVLRRVRSGELVRVTDRGVPIAVIVSLGADDGLVERLAKLTASGRITWAGGKPRGDTGPPRVTGATVADAVVEDRR